jgi:hypothetical protein
VSGFTVDVDGLQNRMPAFTAVADDVKGIFDKLVGVLNDEGACWGGDETGAAFAAKYMEPALAALHRLDWTHQDLHSLVAGLGDWARNYRNVDEVVQKLTAQFGSTLPEL